MNYISAIIIILAFLLGVVAGAVLMALASRQGMREMYHLGYELGREEERQKVGNRWHYADEKPKLHLLYDTYFSEELLVKVKDNTLKGHYYMVAYLNDTDNVWLNPLIEEEIQDDVLQWKYID